MQGLHQTQKKLSDSALRIAKITQELANLQSDEPLSPVSSLPPPNPAWKQQYPTPKDRSIFVTIVEPKDNVEFQFDIMRENICQELQEEHAESQHYLSREASQQARNVLTSKEVLIDELESYQDLPLGIDLKGHLKKIASRILGHHVPRKGDIQAAITKLTSLPECKWALIQQQLAQLFEETIQFRGKNIVFEEALSHAYFLHYRSNDENLWLLNADDNARKGDTDFLEWIKSLVYPKLGHSQHLKCADRMLDYLHYWYCECGALTNGRISLEEFSNRFLEECRDGLNPFENGLFQGAIKKKPHSPFRVFCMPNGKSYTFAKSLMTWYVKKYGMKIKLAQSRTIINDKVAKITSEIYTEINSTEEEEKDQLQQLLDHFRRSYIVGYKTAITSTIEHANSFGFKNLAKRIQEISQTPVTVTSPSGKERHLDDEDGLFGLSPSTKSSQSDRGKNLAAIPFPDLKDPSF